MFQSNFIPVNIGRQNAAIYSEKGVYPAELLKAARAVLEIGESDANVIINDGIVSFISNPEYQWTIPNVYIACEALEVAEKNKFSYFIITNMEKVPQLFVSKSIRQHRLLINALSFDTVIVTKPNLVRKVAAMIDHQYTTVQCINTFETIRQLERSATSYLDALIVDRDTESETMCVSPITQMYTEIWEYYSNDMLEEVKPLLDGSATETENFRVEDKKLVWKLNEGLQALPISHMLEMEALYERLMAKKCNYVCIMGDDMDCHYYVSTNWRFLVNAATFEARVIKNETLKNLLMNYARVSGTRVSELDMVWSLAGAHLE